MSSYFPRNVQSSRFFEIQTLVLLLHCIAIFLYFSVSNTNPVALQKALPMKVQTVKLKKTQQPVQVTTPVSEPIPTSEPICIPVQKETVEEEPKAKPIPKKENVTKAKNVKPQKKKIAKPLPQKKPTPQDTKKRALIDKALSTLNSTKATTSSKKNEPSVQLPQKIGTLSSESLLCSVDVSSINTDQERSYCDELIELLQLILTLPENEEVKVLLTLSRNGKIQDVKIASSKSKKNSVYVKQELYKIHFQPFGSSFQNEPSHTFTLILHSG